MNQWSFYDPTTGMFSGRRLTSSDPNVVKDNTPPGLAAIAGTYDELSQRVDLNTLRIVDYQPPQPSERHQWDTQAKRWRLTPEAVEQEAKRAEAMAEIQRLERDAQPRAQREALLKYDGADARLREIDARITELRKNL